MESKVVKNNKKRVVEILLFLIVMVLSFYTVFHGQNMAQICDMLAKLTPAYLLLAVLAAVFFVAAEGCMIWYLLRALDGKSGLWRCIVYSFIGFFYSGITPSATGGQPVQLYYMKKDGNRLSDCSVVLMVVALIYKFVLVVCGALLLVFWYQPLRQFLQGYFGLYLTGLALNVILVVALCAVMILPSGMKRILAGVERVLVRCHILSFSGERIEKMEQFVDSYRGAVHFLLAHPGKVAVVAGVTFFQRCSMFFLTYFIYRGFQLQGMGMVPIVSLQASVYIAVDMLPVPGAQGITEMMYRSVFLNVFTERFLMPSLYVTRGISFYFLLIVSIGVVAANWIYGKRRSNGTKF